MLLRPNRRTSSESFFAKCFGGRQIINQDAFDRIYFESVLASEQHDGRTAKGNHIDSYVECEGLVETEQAQLLLADAGEIMTKLRVSVGNAKGGGGEERYSRQDYCLT